MTSHRTLAFFTPCECE